MIGMGFGVRNKRRWIGLVALLTVLVNASVVFLVVPEITSHLHDSYTQNGYADGYDQLAANLAAGNGYRMYPDTARTMVREPGYPLLLAGIFRLFGENIAAVKLVNFALALGIGWMLTLIARRVLEGSTLYLVPSMLFLLHPGTLIAESRGGSEMLFAFCLVFFMITIYRAIETEQWLSYAVSGAALGLTVLVRSTPMVFPLFLLIYLIFIGRPGTRPAVCGKIVLMIATMFIALLPWIVRNYLISGQFIPTATVLGVSAHAGLYDVTHVSSSVNWAMADRAGTEERKRMAEQLGYSFKQVQGAYYQDFYSTGDEVRFSSYLFRHVVHQYVRSPSLLPKCMLWNLFNLCFRGKNAVATAANIVIQTPYLLLAGIGITLSVKSRKWKAIAPINLLLFCMVAVYITILAQARYSVPLVPFLSVLACIPLGVIQKRNCQGWLDSQIRVPEKHSHSKANV